MVSTQEFRLALTAPIIRSRRSPVPAPKAHLLALAFASTSLSFGSAAVASPAVLVSLIAPAACPFGTAVDKGDEEAQFIAGLATRGLHDMVVREGKDFLVRRSSHAQASAVRYRVAGALFELGRNAEAIVEYKALDNVAGFEQATEVKFRLGQCSLDTGANEEAVKFLSDALKGKAEYLRVTMTYLLGEALFSTERYDEAGKAYAQVLALGEAGEVYEADSKEYARAARYGVTWSAWKNGDRDETVVAADAFLAAHGDDERAGEIAFLAGEAHLESERPKDALAWYARVKSGSYVEAAMRGAAFAEVAQGAHQRAAQRFGAYRAKFPAGQFLAEATLQEGVQLVRANSFQPALAALAAAGAVDDAQNRYWRSVAFAGLGDHDAALREAQTGLGKGPDEALGAQLRIAAGDALFELGRSDEAARLYEQSGSAYALHAAAVARLNAGDDAEAERLARTLLAGAARQPGTEYRAEALLTRAEALFRMKRYDQAEPVLRGLLVEARPSAQGAPAATKADPSLLARAESRMAWCRWYSDDAASANTLFAALSRNPNATPAERNEATFMAGRTAIEIDAGTRAAQSFSAYLNADPKGPFAAESLLRLGRLTEGAAGAALFERLVAEHGDHELVAAALSELAERRVAGGDTAGAAEAYRALTDRFPTDSLSKNARYGLGWALYQSGDFASASEPLWAVARDGEAAADLREGAFELLVWVEASAKRPERSVEAFDGLLARIDDEDRLLKAARVVDKALVEAKDLDGRAKLWNGVSEKLKGAEAVAAARVEQGFVALDRGKIEDAARLALGARQASPKSPAVAELLLFVGEKYYELGDDEKAAPLYIAASAHGAPEVAERALYKAGFSELRRGKNEAAAAAFATLVERFERGAFAPECMFLAGEAHYRDARYEEASKWMSRMLDVAPQHASRPKALFRLGLAEGFLERWKGSRDALAQLISKNPDFASVTEAELWRGRALSRLDERRAARQSLSRVVEADEGILAAQARIEIGRLSEKENDLEGAVAEYLKVAFLYGHAEECAEALVRAGDVLDRTGKKEKAREQYDEAIAEYPKTEWAAKARERIAKADQK